MKCVHKYLCLSTLIIIILIVVVLTTIDFTMVYQHLHSVPKNSYNDLLTIAEYVRKRTEKETAAGTNEESNPTVGELYKDKFDNSTLWGQFYNGISSNSLYPANDTIINELLKFVSKAPIVKLSENISGTQFKLIVDFEGGGQALFKPQRHPREKQSDVNHFMFSDFERHNAEIAAFHLDRLLGFRISVPVVGRIINMTEEFLPIAEDDFLRTFYISPAQNLCFKGTCSQQCDHEHAICGRPDQLEGSFALFLPDIERRVYLNPWKNSYDPHRAAPSDGDSDFCDLVRQRPPYNKGRRLKDMVDLGIFDFLIGNSDRHNYETFKIFGDNTAILNFDHGRAFGRPYTEDLFQLSPLYQCCLINHSTLLTLLKFHNGPKFLSDAMRESMSEDPVAPVLWEPHLEALDRRIITILNIVRSCVQNANDTSQVVV